MSHIVEDFEGMNSGDINGQDDWYGSTTWDRSSTSQEGSYAMSSTNSSWPIISKDYATSPDYVMQSYYFKVSESATWGHMGSIRNQADAYILQIRVHWNKTLGWSNSTSSDEYIKSMTGLWDTWVAVELHVLENGNVQVVADGTTSAERGPYTSFTSIDSLSITQQRTTFIDAIDGTSPSAGGAAFVPKVTFIT